MTRPAADAAHWTSSVGERFDISSDENQEADSRQATKRRPQRDNLLTLTDDVELWRDLSGEAFATFIVNGHREHRKVRSREFKQFLALSYLQANGGTLGGQALEDALRVLEARAVFEGLSHPVWLRVGKRKDSMYVDLCDDRWRAIELTADGWRVVDEAPIKFLRTPAMRPLPEPKRGECIERLGSFVNTAEEDDFHLIVAWLVGALSAGTQFPILAISGEQGSGKSLCARLLRSLIDPNEALIRSTPRDERDLSVAVANAHVLAFDNLSSVQHWFADALCRVATGSGFVTRRLHTDRDEEVFCGARPIVLNGIPNLTDRADLASRALAIHLPTIPEHQRRPEDEFWRDFEDARPELLGSLFDAVCAALRNVSTTRLERLPRMATFAKWVTAAETGLGWEFGTFLAAYERNRSKIFEEAADADSLVLLIRDKWDRLRDCADSPQPNAWEGSPGELLGHLNSIADEGVLKAKSWPATPAALGTRIRRSAPTLRRCGFHVESRKSGTRMIRIVKDQT